MLNTEVKKFMESSVLCWLATADEHGQPNVSPKEMFLYQDEQTLLIAHLASPVSVRNIRQNPKVCVSFLEVFVQKGFKVKGEARIIGKGEEEYQTKLKVITDKYTDRFPVQAIIEVTVTSVDRILAPSYVFFPAETTEEGQIASAKRTYGVG